MNKKLITSIFVGFLLLALTIYAASASVVINEIMPQPGSDYDGSSIADAFDEYIEIYNTGDTEVDTANWILYDTTAASDNYTFADPSSILPYSYVVIYRSTPGPILNNAGDTVVLEDNTATIIDQVTYGASALDVAQGRAYDGAPEPFVALSTPTPGAANDNAPTDLDIQVWRSGDRIDNDLVGIAGYDFALNQNSDDIWDSNDGIDTSVSYSGEGAVFNGVNSFIDTTVDSDLYNGEFTQCIWFKTDTNTTTRDLTGNYGSNTGGVLVIIEDNSNLIFRSHNGSVLTSIPIGTIAENSENKLCIGMDSTYLWAILNNNPQVKGNALSNLGNAGVDKIYIGKELSYPGDGRFWDGKVKRMELYDRSLSISEIHDLFSSNNNVDRGDSLQLYFYAQETDESLEDLTINYSIRKQNTASWLSTGGLTPSTNYCGGSCESTFPTDEARFDDFIVPNAYEKGCYEISLVVTDTPGLSSEETQQKEFCIDNIAPELDIPGQNINEETPIIINLFTYASDADGDFITFSRISHNDSKVVCDITGGTTLEIIPQDDFFGSSTCTIRADDGYGGIKDSTFTIDVDNINDVPTLVIPTQTTDEETDKTINLDDFSNDADGDSLSYSRVSHDDTKVVCDISGGNMLEIIPQTDFIGDSTCTIQADDSNGGIIQSTFTIHVLDVNDPFIVDDIFPAGNPTIDEGESQMFEVNISDIDNVEHNYNWSINGTTNLSGIGENRFEFTYIAGQTDAGDYLIKVNITDGENSEEISWTLTVIAVNVPPVITSNYPADGDSFEENQTIPINFTAVDVDLDTLTYKIKIDANPWENTDATTWTPDFFSAGSHTIKFRAYDGTNTTTMTINIDITNLNQLPVWMEFPDAKTTYVEDNVPDPLYINLSRYINDTEDDELTDLTYEILSQSDEGFMNCSVNVNKDLKCVGYEANSTGVNEVELKATDLDSGEAATTFVLTVTPVNDAPVVEKIQTYLEDVRVDGPGIKDVKRGETITIWAEANDVDNIQQDLAYWYSIRKNGDANWNYLKDEAANEQCFTDDCLPSYNAKYLSFDVPIDADLGFYDVRAKAGDDEINSTKINNNEYNVINNNPEISGLETISIVEDNNVTINLSNYVWDDLSLELLTWSKLNNPENLTITITADNLLIVSGANFSGTRDLSLRVDDTDGGFDETNVTVTVDPVNDAPTIAIPAQAFDEDTTLTINLSNPWISYDVENDPLAYSVIDEDTGKVDCQIVNNTLLKMTPTLNWYGDVNCTIEVDDGALTAQSEFTITVNPINDKPWFDDIQTQTAIEGIRFTYDIEAHDIESVEKNMTFSRSSTASGSLTINSTSGMITYTPDPADSAVGNVEVDVTVDDNDVTEPNPLTNSTMFNITVIPSLNPFDIDLTIDGTSYPDYKEGKVINYIRPLSEVEVRVKLKNMLSNNIEDIEITAVNAGLGVDDLFNVNGLTRFNLGPGAEKQAGLNFDVPTPITEGIYNLVVTGTGTEVYGPGLTETRTFTRVITLNLTKEYHNLIISNIATEQDTFKCIRQGMVTVSTKNLGFMLEQNANLTLTNPTLGLLNHTAFNIDVNNEVNKTLQLNFKNAAPGPYTIMAGLSYNNGDSQFATSFDVEVEACGIATVTVPEDTKYFDVDLWQYTSNGYNGSELVYDLAADYDTNLLNACGLVKDNGDDRYLNCTIVANATGTTQVNINVSKGDYKTELPVTVVVTPINDAPFWKTVDVDALVPVKVKEESYNDTINLSALIGDIDNSLADLDFIISTTTNLSAVVYGAPGNRFLNISSPIKDLSKVNEYIDLTVTDGSLTSTYKDLRVRINNKADDPDLFVEDKTVFARDTLKLVLQGEDVDGGQLTYSKNVSFGNIAPNPVDGFANFTWTPDDSDVGIHSINFTVEDDVGRTSSYVATIIVQNANEAPFDLVVNPDTTTVNQDATVTFAISAEDDDIQFGDELTFTASNPDVIVTKLTAKTAKATYTPNGSVVGADPSVDVIITFVVTDTLGKSNSTNATVTVNNVNDAPFITSSTPKGLTPVITEDGQITLSATASDYEDDAADIRMMWKVWNASAGKYDWQQNSPSYTFKASQWGGAGTYKVFAQAKDTDDAESEKVEWTITASEVPLSSSGEYYIFYTASPNIENVVDLVIEKPGFGKIEFNPVEGFNLSNIGDIDALANFALGTAGLDSSQTTGVFGFKSATATITLEGLPFASTPTIYYNSGFSTTGNTVCPASICSNIVYSGGFLTFDVAHFSTFWVNISYPACSDGLDNDADGLIDMADPGCSSPTDDDEYNSGTPLPKQCNDGIDNDGDGKTDYPLDPGCSSTTDDSELDAGTPGPVPQINTVILGGADTKASNPRRYLEVNDSKTFNFKNEKAENIVINGYNITIQKSGLQVSDLLINLKSIADNTLAPDEETSVLIEGRISEKLDAVDANNVPNPIKVATITFFGELGSNTSSNIGSFDVFMQRENKLEFKRIDASYADNNEKISDDDTIKNLKPGDDISFDMRVENKYSRTENIDMEDVTISLEAVNSNDENNLDLSDDLQDINTISSNDDKSDQLTVGIESDADDGTMPIYLKTEGVDEYGARHGETWNVDLKVEREDDEVIIERVDISPDTLSCDFRTVFVSLELFNSGKDKQDEIAVTVDAPALDFYEKIQDIELDEDDGTSKTFGIIPPRSLAPGTYPVEIQVFIDDDELMDSEVLYLTVQRCSDGVIDYSDENSLGFLTDPRQQASDEEVILTTSTVNPPLPAQLPVLGETDDKEETTKKSVVTFRDSSAYITLLIVLFIILVGFVIFIGGAAVILNDKKKRQKAKKSRMMMQRKNGNNDNPIYQNY